MGSLDKIGLVQGGMAIDEMGSLEERRVWCAEGRTCGKASACGCWLIWGLASASLLPYYMNLAGLLKTRLLKLRGVIVKVRTLHTQLRHLHCHGWSKTPQTRSDQSWVGSHILLSTGGRITSDGKMCNMENILEIAEFRGIRATWSKAVAGGILERVLAMRTDVNDNFSAYHSFKEWYIHSYPLSHTLPWCVVLCSYFHCRD